MFDFDGEKLECPLRLGSCCNGYTNKVVIICELRAAVWRLS